MFYFSLSLQPTISTDSSDSPQSVDGQDEQRHVNDSSFEQFIDLGLPNKNVELQSTGSTLTQNEADVINSNNVVEVEPPQSPLIAFEDNAPKMNDPQGSFKISVTLMWEINFFNFKTFIWQKIHRISIHDIKYVDSQETSFKA